MAYLVCMPATTTASPAVFAQLAMILENLAADEHIKVDDPVTTAARLIAALDDAGTTLADQKLLDEIGAELADAQGKLADFPTVEVTQETGKPTRVRIEHKTFGVIDGHIESRSAADRRARLNDAVSRELLGTYAIPNSVLRSAAGL
ncbi:hypothetical protein PBI_JACE_68 [Gordonia phage Jace]|uniref:Uncharacterized protein n=1 Tax=Gordonia phage Jace TaxID=2182360 RepID=A0A2U8UJC1_9CAUD|nr:hypothetical protein HOT28_gp68 [Gordonia phage Jace]AWN03688.1 hypothetical protein PBI_JACE_68 [Gordonia phage Jace]